MLFHRLVLCVFCLVCAFFWGCTATLKKIPIDGRLAGQQIESTVDSELARYYVEHYLQGRKIKPAFDSIIDTLYENHDQGVPCRDTLKALAKTYSVDFVTLYLARHILTDHANGPIQRLFDQQRSKLKFDPETARLLSQPYDSSYLVLFVPGWFYKTDPWTGADLARQRHVASRLGLDHLLVEIDENGTVEENGQFIAQAILRYSGAGKKIIVVSVSKAGPEVAVALGEVLDWHQTRPVKAWINIGGLLQGTLIADAALDWPSRWLTKAYFLFKKLDIESVESMTTRRSRRRFARLNIPKHLLIINYLGIPLSGDVTVLARDRYMKLRREGPNDGLTLITDAIAPHSITLAQLGFDHFFWDPEIDIKAAALIRAVISYLESLNIQKLGNIEAHDPWESSQCFYAHGEQVASGHDCAAL